MPVCSNQLQCQIREPWNRQHQAWRSPFVFGLSDQRQQTIYQKKSLLGSDVLFQFHYQHVAAWTAKSMQFCSYQKSIQTTSTYSMADSRQRGCRWNHFQESEWSWQAYARTHGKRRHESWRSYQIKTGWYPGSKTGNSESEKRQACWNSLYPKEVAWETESICEREQHQILWANFSCFICFSLVYGKKGRPDDWCGTAPTWFEAACCHLCV